MNVFTLLFGLPLAPVRGLAALTELLRDQAERELYDPSVARRQLEDVEEQRASGEISAQEEESKQQEILDRLMQQPGAESPDQ